MIRQSVERALRVQIGNLSDLAAQALLEPTPHASDDVATSAIVEMLDGFECAITTLHPGRGVESAVRQISEPGDSTGEYYAQAKARVEKLRRLAEGS